QGPGCRRNWPSPRLMEAASQACARVGDQLNFTGVAWLEADGCSRRNVQAIAEGSLSIEGESRIGLGEMIVTADLNRPVARVGDAKGDGCPILVEDNLARCRKNLARNHAGPRIAIAPAPTRAPVSHPIRFNSGKNCGASRRSNIP